MSINIGTLDIGVAFAGDTSGLQKATADAQQGIDRFGASTSKAMRQVREDTQGAEDALSRLSQGFKGAVIGSGVAVGLIKLKNTAIEVGDALIQAQVQLDKLNNGFKFGGGGAAGGARELAFVREEANRLGLELGGAATQYMQMVAAARGTNMEGAKTRELFTSIAEASTVMGMSGEQSERAMQAVVQMMTKGKVQAEELRGQLGEHLPGAFAIAARAMGVTEVELNKLMETGQVMSADFLPKFAAQLRSELGGSVEDATKSMQASLNRYETAWLTFKQNVAQTGVSEALGGQINILSDAFNGVSERMEAARKAGGGFWSQTAAGAGGVAAFLNPINALSYSAISLQGQLEQAKTKLNELEKERPYSGNIFLGPAIEETKLLIAELERAKAARDQLARQPGTGLSESRYSAVVDAAATASQQAQGQAYAKLMTDMANPQEKLTAAIFKAKQELGELYSPAIEARLREHFIKPTREAKKEVDDLTKAAVRGEKLFGDLSATEGGLAGDFAEKWGDLSAAYAKTYINAEQLLAAQAALLKLQPFYKKGLDEEKEAAKEQAKATAEAAKAYDAYYDAVQKNTDTLQGNIQSENEAAAAIGLSAIAIAELEAVKLQDMATSKERAALTWESIDLSGEMTAKLRAEAKALRDLAAAKVNRAVKETAADEAKQAADAWKKASEQIEKDITDALMRGFESGKGFAEVLRDTVANMFKTLVLRPVVQATVQGGLNAIGLGGGAGGALGTVSNGLSLYNAGSSALNWLGLGASAGTGLAATAGTGLSLASTGTGLGLSASAGGLGLTGTAASGASLSSGLAASTAAASGGSAMASIAAAAPWALAGLAVLSLIKSMDDSGTYHTGGLGSYSAAGGMATGDAVKSQGLDFGLASKDYTASSAQAATQMAQAVVGLLDSTAQTFGGKAGAYAATAFADDTSKDGAWGALMVRIGDQTVIDWKNGTDKWPGREFADGEAGAREYAAAVAKDVRDYLITQTPDWADTMLNALGDAPSLEALGQVVAQINAAATAIETMGMASQAFAGLSEAATSALISGMGGAESAVSSLSGYYANFYTEAERSGIATQQLTEQFAALGQELPASREAFRGLVDAAIAAGDTTLAAGLISLQDEFAALVPAAEAAATAVGKSADALEKAYMDVLDANASKYLSAPAAADYTYTRAAQQLAALGFSQFSKELLASTDVASIKAYVTALAQSGGATAEVLGQVIKLSDGLIALKDAAAQADKDYMSVLDANAKKYLGAEEFATYYYSRAADQLGALGQNFTASMLENTSADTLKTYVVQLAQTGGITADVLSQIISLTDGLIDLKTAASEAADEARTFLAGFTRDIRAYLDGLNAQAPGAQGYNNAAAAFSSQLTLARGGDRDALGGITGYASTLIDAIKRESNTAAEAATRIGRVRGQLAALPGQLSAEQLIVNAINAASKEQAAAAAAAAIAITSGYNTAIAGVVSTLGLGFATLDTNLSNSLDFTEFSAALQGKATDAEIQRLFALIDTDNDGIISKLEAQVAATSTIGQQVKTGLAADFAKLDTSVNGALDFAEFYAGFQGLATDATLREIFNLMDVDGNGQISELEAIRAASATTAANTYAIATTTPGAIASGGAGFGEAQGTASSAGPNPTVGQYENAVDYYAGLGAISDYYAGFTGWDNAAQQLANINQIYDQATALDVSANQLSAAIGIPVSDIQKVLTDMGLDPLRQYAKGGMHPGGLRLVGENGPELEVTGPSRIYSNADTISLLRSGGANNAELVAEMRAMREDNQAQARALVQLQQRLVKLNERWDVNGLPSTRIEA